MCRSGLANDMPYIISMTIWWLSPMPRTSRPSVASLVVTAWAARAAGWRG